MTADQLASDNLEELENTVTSLITEALPFLEVRVFHEGFDQMSFKHPYGCVLIHFTTTEYSDISQGNQQVSYNVEVNLVVRSIVQQSGAYRILKAIRTVINTKHIAGIGRLFIKNQQLITKEGALWHYIQNYKCIGVI